MSNRLQIILEAVTDQFDRGFRNASETLQRFSQRTHDLHRRMDGFARRHRAGFDALQTSGLAAAAGLGAMAYGIKGAVDEAIKFESAMAGVKKVIDFDTPQAFKQMEGDILAMSQRLPMTAEGLANIMASAGQANIAKEDLSRFTETAAKMGVAFDISAEEAGQAMAEMRTAFKMSQTEVETLSDKINYLGNTSPNSAAKIMQITQAVGPIGELGGFAADQIAALASVIVGMDPSNVATGLKNISLQLTAGENATKSQRVAFEKLGLSAEDVAKKMKENAVGTLTEVTRLISETIPEHEQSAVATMLVGREALPVFAQLIQNQEIATQKLNDMGDASKYAGSMLKEFESMAGTSQAQMQLFDNNITAVKIALGSALLPAINGVMQALTPMLQAIAQWAKENPKLVTAIAAITAGALALVVGLGLLATAFLAVSGGLSAIAGIAELAGVAIGGLSAPVVAVIAVVAALGYAAYQLYENWDKVTQELTLMWEALVGSATDHIEGIVGAYDGLVDGVSLAMMSVETAVTNGWASAKDTALSLVQSIKETAISTFDSLPAPIQSALSVVGKAFSTQFALIETVVQTAFNVIKALVRGDMNGVKQAIAQGLQLAISIVKNGVANIVGAFKSLGGELYRVGKSAVEGLVKGIKEKATEAIAAAKNLASTVISATKSAFAINSPSKKMIPVGKSVVKGLTAGMSKEQKKAAEKAKKVAEDVIKSAQDVIDNNKRALAIFGQDELFALNYDIDFGKYKGVSEDKLNEMRQSVIALQDQKKAHDELNNALKLEEDIAKRTEQVRHSILDIQKQMANLNAVDSLKWDIEHNEQYKDISQAVLDDYIAIVSAQEQQKLLEQDIAKQTENRQSATQKVLGDMYELNKQIALYQNNNPLASFDYDHANGVFGGASLEDIALKRKALAKLAFLQSNHVEQDGFSKLQSELDDRLAIIKNYEDTHTGIEQEAQEARYNALQTYTQAKNNLLLTQYDNVFGSLTSIAKDGLGEQSKVYRAMFAMQKGFAIAQSAIAIQQAVSQGLAKGFPMGLPDIAMAVAEGAKIVSAIKSVVMPVGQAHDGIMSVPKSGTWNLQKGERVLPRHTAKALDDKLNTMGGGGQVINVNVTVNSNGGDVQADEQMGRRFGDVIKLAVQSELLKERKQGGLLYGR